VEKSRKIFNVAGAIVLSLLMPGLSQISSGKIKRGIVLYLVSQALFLLAVYICILPFPSFNIILPLVIIVFVYVFVTRDAIILARNPDSGLKMQPLLSGALLVGILIVNTSLLKPMIKTIINEHLVEAFHIPSASMSPLLLPGDYILASKLPNSTEPKRGDIVVFHSPTDPSRRLIKRVVGLGGELIEVKENKLYTNNSEQEEKYVGSALPDDPSLTAPPNKFGPASAPAGSVFVLNDNRKFGSDSRSWGFIEENQIIGRAATIYWSWDKETRSVRWDRIGKAIK
jgi:signal peptidase I